ncbi:MAG TPA: histidine--tRNA ligase [Fimbriimonadaceae bacterium]|nr:histidine--tRNA ligase [Fimbriimonadaceae bacterium]
MKYQGQRGTEDVLPTQSHLWQYVESRFRAHASSYGYLELRTPTFEDYDLFVRSSGESSEAVSKQMYDFRDKGDRHIALKPEGTAPAMRSLIQHNLCPQGTVARLSYITNCFRYERPQKGRLRELHQFGLEIVGSGSPLADAEIIEASARFYQSLGVPSVVVLLNCLGNDECRSRYRTALLDFAMPLLNEMGEEAIEKAKKNPLRLLDSKDPQMIEGLKEAPVILDFLDDPSREHFERLKDTLTFLGIEFRVAPEIVRGLDYYTGAVFEIQSEHLGSQSALCGGGRYDNLIKELGGPDLPSVGVGMGVERLLIVMEQLGLWPEAPKPDLFVAFAGSEHERAALGLAATARNSGLTAIIDPDAKSLKSQLRQADRLGVRFVAIIGDDEAAASMVTLRNLSDSSQELMSEGALLERVKG